MEQTNHNFLSGGGQTGISDRMRELLSRAAQEHLSEQKTQDAITEEMRANGWRAWSGCCVRSGNASWPL